MIGESDVLCMFHSTVLEFWKAEDAPKECQRNTRHKHAYTPHLSQLPPGLKRELERKYCAVLTPGTSKTSALKRASGQSAEKAPSPTMAREYALFKIKALSMCLYNVGVDVSLTIPLKQWEFYSGPSQCCYDTLTAFVKQTNKQKMTRFYTVHYIALE